MRNTDLPIMKAWYEAIGPEVAGFPVFRVEADYGVAEYVLLRVESSSNIANKDIFRTNPIMTVEIVARFEKQINDTRAALVDDAISQIILPTPRTIGLVQQPGFNITDVNIRDRQMIQEDDGTYKYHRLITNYNHIINHS